MNQFPRIDKTQCTILYQNFDCPWGGKETIYLVPLDMLHLNADNGRIATWVSGHESDPNAKKFSDMTREEWNATLIKFIQESSSKEDNDRTRRSLYQDGQLKVGAILSDGTVVAGNRRCSILMSLLHDTGNHERFGYFKCAIFDVPDTEEGRKQLKRLETRTQYGEDTPVAYGPIEKLVDIYNNVIGPNHPYSASEYQNFLGLKKSQMDNLIIRATILVDYLNYIGKPGNYEIARVEKLDGPINELAGLFKKCSEREWNRIKGFFYKTVSEGKEKKGDRSRDIRDQVKIYYSRPEDFEQFLEAEDDDLLNEDATQLGGSGGNGNARTDPTRREKIKKLAEEVKRDSARTIPISCVQDALDKIGKLDRADVLLLKPEERTQFFKKIEALIRQAQKYTKDQFE